ncbi:MAG TPA: glycosyltransferase family 2 protein [Acidimicrobiales bacterium]|nr:glycosyltransferase family 2 protein [Acidimicrobiales bacterium]
MRTTPREERRRALDALVDQVALEEFAAAHGAVALPPVAIVIAAYHEVDNIDALLEKLPGNLCDLDARAIVVIDGEEDGTAAKVRAAGQLAVIAPVNRGQGAALRLGYRVARERGAKYVVTADGDGQGDPADLGRALEPVVAGAADFVNGSRRLGATESDDKMRNTGVLVYARLISALTGTKVTDTANPIRAMRAALTASLTLHEPQYQASELLISAIATGARYREVPMTMRARASGASKKGGNLAYGYRYGKVVLRTWWRERPLLKASRAKR